MAKTIRLASGGYVTRAWGGGSFYFEVGGLDQCDGQVRIEPDRKEMLAIASLFRRAALKAAKAEEKTEYEAPTLTHLGKHLEGCPVRVYGKVVARHCTCNRAPE